MVAAFDFCLHGKGGAAPSIDTAMHGLVDAAHVDHLHPDSGIAIATAADGEALTKEIFGDKVVWVPWRRPGLPARPRHRRDQGGATRRRSGASSAGTASPPGARPATSARAQLALDHRHRGRRTSPSTAGPSRSARSLDGYAALPEAERRARAAALAPTIRGIASARPRRWSATSPTPTSCSTSSRAPSTRGWPRSGTSCPDHFLRTKVKPMVLDLPADGHRRGGDRAARGAARGLPRGLPRLLRRATRPTSSPAIRGADPLIVLVPGVGMFSLRQGQADRPRRRRVLRQRDQRDARRRGALDVRSPSTSRRSSASSTGRSRRPSCSGCRSPSRSRPGSRW